MARRINKKISNKKPLVKAQPPIQVLMDRSKQEPNPLNSYFDKIFCINLSKRTDRWSLCLNEFRLHGLKVQRFPATEGTSLPPKNDWMRGGRLGCAMSHLGVLKEMVKNNFKRILILEDDIAFVPNFNRIVKERIKLIPNDFDVFYFGGNNPQTVEQINEYVWRIKSSLTLHAYSVSLNFAKYIIPHIEQMDDAVDCIYRRHTPNFKCYIFMPYLVTQKPGYSDIENRETDYSVVINADFKNVQI